MSLDLDASGLDVKFLMNVIKAQACLAQHRVRCLRTQQMGPYLAVRSKNVPKIMNDRLLNLAQTAVVRSTEILEALHE